MSAPHSLLPEAAITKLIRASQIEPDEACSDARSLAVAAALRGSVSLSDKIEDVSSPSIPYWSTNDMIGIFLL